VIYCFSIIGKIIDIKIMGNESRRLQKRYTTAGSESRHSSSKNDFAVHDFLKRVAGREQTRS
jgi:hypothetical protein